VSTLPVARTLDGKYRLDRLLGRGGMGAVHEAADLRLERRVAIKIMTGALFGNQVALRRFEREARAAARLDHVDVTRVYDYGAIGSGGAYLIMEYVSGRTWRAELQRSNAIEPARAADWFHQLLDGLQFAHDAGIVHRDLKPENVMVARRPSGGDQLKIMDFGLAKIHGATSSGADTLTQAGVAVGTIGYMSPEELGGGEVDARADIFSIGVMVVEALTGERPFSGRTPQQVITALLHAEYHLPGDAAGVRALDAIVQRALARNRAERYGSAADLAHDLVPAIRACPAFAPPQPPEADPGDTREHR
jgi:serine/threonine protein kinase